MKRCLVLILILVLLVGCSNEESASEYLYDPAYERAGMRAEIGYVFHEDDTILGFQIDGIGTFLFNLIDKKFQNKFYIYDDSLKNYYVVPAMSIDKQSLVFHFEEAGQGTLLEKGLRYDISNNTLFHLESKDSIPVLKSEWSSLQIDENRMREWLLLENLYHITANGEKLYPFAEDITWKHPK